MLMLLGELDADNELGRDDNELNSDDALDITTTDADDSTDTLNDVAASELWSDFTGISAAASTASELFSGNLLNFLSLIDLAGVVGDKMMMPLILTETSLLLYLILILISPFKYLVPFRRF